ncbi:hypothetical protein LTR56_010967 [Elasticomyces elasticus]|nr:hypothetical protein LTR56_010967 [Elasticomyces elasticus]KAK3662665.1 hypothetical protein LTR22_006515 [Elasticomyces elasticus]KAK4926551.1 hypothetical protein LTR49_006485 [Elasticomyces elasticus]KAK5760644.1 hypothetical protein LTS12_009181 [Elasticomyces elasticus]
MAHKHTLEVSVGRSDEEPATKRTKPDESFNPFYSSMWDEISKVYYTKRSLAEFDRRTAHESGDKVLTSARRKFGPLLRSDICALRDLASKGGPDLSILKGYSWLPTVPETKSVTNSAARSAGNMCSAYDANFERVMIEKVHVFPPNWRDPHRDEDDETREPQNLGLIRDVLIQSRDSLAPSQWPEKNFREFKRAAGMNPDEEMVVKFEFPFVSGLKDSQYVVTENIRFDNLDELHKDIVALQPDKAYGADRNDINSNVREELARYIVPVSTSALAAPNSFMELMGSTGHPGVAQRQAMHDGAVGARAMFYLQNYGKAIPEYDDNAYTLSSTYHPIGGILQMFATHLVAPPRHGDEPHYHMTRIKTFAVKDLSSDFREGAAAWRNGQLWAQQQRDAFIQRANDVDNRRSAALQQASAGASNEKGDEDTAADVHPSTETVDGEGVALERFTR